MVETDEVTTTNDQLKALLLDVLEQLRIQREALEELKQDMRARGNQLRVV